jgi:hypothetical protein
MYTEMNEGWVWVSNDNFRPRSVIKIEHKINKTSVYCEHLKIDDKFVNIYNASKNEKINRRERTIVISQWYRDKLDIDTNKRYDLQITPANCWWGRYRACRDHPQLVVRLSINLAIISVVLGILSIYLSF